MASQLRTLLSEREGAYRRQHRRGILASTVHFRVYVWTKVRVGIAPALPPQHATTAKHAAHGTERIAKLQLAGREPSSLYLPDYRWPLICTCRYIRSQYSLRISRSHNDREMPPHGGLRSMHIIKKELVRTPLRGRTGAGPGAISHHIALSSRIMFSNPEAPLRPIHQLAQHWPKMHFGIRLFG